MMDSNGRPATMLADGAISRRADAAAAGNWREGATSDGSVR
jgi:hypothetical protein